MSPSLQRVLPCLVYLLVALGTAGCASSIFDAPYVELEPEESRTAEAVSAVAETDAGDLAELLASQQVAKRHYTDLWERIRDGFGVGDMDKDPQVFRIARRFAGDRLIERIAARAAGFLYYVVEEVDQRGLPMEVVLVPFVESGYTLEARSDAEAHGAWQFIENTAKTYELRVDRFRDERRSLIASTRAALDYLTMLHDMFGSWPLAFAAYNCGEKRIQAEVERARARGIAHPGFADVAARLPVETREYVPRIFAVKAIIAQPAAFKAALPSIENTPRYSVVRVSRDVDVVLAASLAGLGMAEFQALNPSLRAPVIFGRSGTDLLLPHDAALRLVLGMQTHEGPWVSWHMLRITRPATPGEIARRNNLPVRLITQANPLPEGHLYAVGSVLLLPGKARSGESGIDPELLANSRLVTRAATACSSFLTCRGSAGDLPPPVAARTPAGSAAIQN